MAIPFQCLVARNSHTAVPTEWTLFGASGPTLVVQSSTGTTSTWPEQPSKTVDDHQDNENQERPGKRIKLEHPKEHKANFASLILSHDGQYLVGITGEDKTIRVFKIDAQNRLHQLSERCMSRRPCSIVLTSDDSIILCADKFGDVYALPLFHSPDDELPETPTVPQPEQKEKDFTPSATTLTVHSGRNRKTLEEQLKQKAKGIAKSKEPMRFKHELLLGHVSMLTDIISTEVDGRKYIITADRDEHIRVSRGQPQAHIIEGFCFGHESFISTLCITASGKLVSGGGDDDLFVWDWQNYRLLERLPIRNIVLDHLKNRPELAAVPQDDIGFKVAVSGIWNVPGSSNDILVACEGIPAIFSFDIGSPASAYAIALNGNALAVSFLHVASLSHTVVVSTDNVQKPGSTTEPRADKVSRLQYLSRAESGRWQENTEASVSLRSFEQAQGTATKVEPSSTESKAIQSMLYGVENLRKRPGSEE
ncbi:tRNA methyltransferas-like protein [Plenodomus tracheiphilus IPT5]|uniref:tRNA methyltransferas-like protein n=1 Tax=Plenodomus tracheiphilus IPT5 TaxID=1408161 RepID=A0A6A7BKV8_9PLEO|nr:tRNA methyltransferas-like protein [Plenodomus tracheiphilus IPT5]